MPTYIILYFSRVIISYLKPLDPCIYKIILIGILWFTRIYTQTIICTYILLLLYERVWLNRKTCFTTLFIGIYYIHSLLFNPNKLICTSDAHCGCYIVRKRDDNRATLFYIYNIIYVPRARVLIQFWHVRSCVTLYNIIYRILSICRVILLLSHNLNFRQRNTIFRKNRRYRYLKNIYFI